MYENYCKLRDSKGLKNSEVAREIGIPRSTFSDWKSGRSHPKTDKLQKIADYFGVTIEYLMKGEEAEVKYYTNDETARMVQEAFDDPDIRILLSAKKDLTPNEFNMVLELIKTFKNK